MPQSLPADNFLQNVQTYQQSDLGPLYICNPLIFTANTMFDDFQNFSGQLGDTVTFDKPLKFVGSDSLIADFEPITQRVQSLKVDKAFNVPIQGNAQQFIFNIDAYMDRIGLPAIRRIGGRVSQDVATLAETNTYRCYGDGRSPINSFAQLDQALEGMRDYGDPGYPTRGYLPNTVISAIINSGINQFVPGRNEEIAQSWMLGDFAQCSWHRVTNMPKHISGAFGEIDPSTLALTISSVSADGSSLTFTSAGGTESKAFAAYDIITIDPNNAVGAFFLQFTQFNTTSQKIQVAVQADAASSGGTVTVSVYPALVSGVDKPSDNAKNINVSLADLVGATATVTASHNVGFIVGGNALFLAMPRLPDQYPFPSSQEVDEETGISMRVYYGNIPTQNVMGLVHDVIWGKTLVPEYAMRLAFPLVS
jgi:hypothetical protein